MINVKSRFALSLGLGPDFLKLRWDLGFFVSVPDPVSPQGSDPDPDFPQGSQPELQPC